MKSHKIRLCMAAILLVLCSLAQAESPLTELADAGVALLFDTENVTIRAEADFSLDGEPFKHFTGTHIQVGTDMDRDILLKTPKEDGTVQETGYVIMVDGSDKITYNRHWQQADFYHAIIHRNTVLRRSVETDNLIALGRSILAQAEAPLSQHITVTDSHSWSITLNGEAVPGAANALLTLLLQKFGYYRAYLDYRLFSPDSQEDIWDYSTITEGILFCTSGLQLEQLELKVQTDTQGRLAGLEGTARLTLLTRSGAAHDLSVSFHAALTDYGTSVLPEFPIPADELRAAQQEMIRESLTEIYSYEREEADTFLLDVQGGIIVCYPPEHPDWKYEYVNGTLYTPFSTNFDYYPGEGTVRVLLRLAREYQWLDSLTNRNKTILQTWLEDLRIIPNDTLLACLQYDSEATPEQFIRAYFQSCYGSEEDWPAILTEWCEDEIDYWKQNAAEGSDPAANLVYYNPDGGSHYHADMNCISVSDKYLPLAGSCPLEELDANGLESLEPCNVCVP